jgi:hypothetical protein
MAGNAERTYLMIKPDGVQRGLVGKIIERFETRGYKLVRAPASLSVSLTCGSLARTAAQPQVLPRVLRSRRRSLAGCRCRPPAGPISMASGDAMPVHPSLTARPALPTGGDEVLRSVPRAHGEALR